MVEIRRILAPTDFSDHAAVAVRYACGLAERLGAELHLLNVIAEVVVPPGPDPMLVPTLPPEYYRETEGEAATTLARLLDPSWGTPTRVERAVRWGEAVEEIDRYAAAQQIDLLVIATHGRSGLLHVLLGSVAERLVRESPCPVLTIRSRK